MNLQEGSVAWHIIQITQGDFIFLQNTQETSVLQNSFETIHPIQLSYLIKREAGDLPK